MRPPLSSISPPSSMWLLSLASVLSLPPASLPQMPRFDLSSGSAYPGPRQTSPASPGSLPRCPGPGEVPWCQCREDNSGLSVSCHNINQVRLMNNSNWCSIDSSYRVPQSNFKLYLSEPSENPMAI